MISINFHIFAEPYIVTNISSIEMIAYRIWLGDRSTSSSDSNITIEMLAEFDNPENQVIFGVNMKDPLGAHSLVSFLTDGETWVGIEPQPYSQHTQNPIALVNPHFPCMSPNPATVKLAIKALMQSKERRYLFNG